jgi:hypothetical protein
MDAVPVLTLQIVSTDIRDPTKTSRRMRIPVEECESVWSTLRALLITHYRYAKLNHLIRWVTYKKPNEEIKCRAAFSARRAAHVWQATRLASRRRVEVRLRGQPEPREVDRTARALRQRRPGRAVASRGRDSACSSRPDRNAQPV